MFSDMRGCHCNEYCLKMFSYVVWIAELEELEDVIPMNASVLAFEDHSKNLLLRHWTYECISIFVMFVDS